MPEPRQGAIPGAPYTDAEHQAYLLKNEEEWGQWIADPNGPGIFHNGALAYVAGSPVPVSNVEKYAYDKQGLVVRNPNAKKADKPSK